MYKAVSAHNLLDHFFLTQCKNRYAQVIQLLSEKKTPPPRNSNFELQNARNQRVPEGCLIMLPWFLLLVTSSYDVALANCLGGNQQTQVDNVILYIQSPLCSCSRAYKELSRKQEIISNCVTKRDQTLQIVQMSSTSPLSPSTTCAREKREIKVASAKVSRKTDEQVKVQEVGFAQSL